MAFPKRESFRMDQQLLSGRSQALCHPARLMILELLKQKAMHVRDMAKAVPLVQATISGHLEILMRVGFIEVQINGRYNLYSINTAALERYRVDIVEYVDGIVEGAGEVEV